jgi:LPXTG-motif cell wall-anchored protein
VRILGVASASAAIVLGLSSSAFACNIGDFKAEATCAGDKGQIVITDTDSSNTKAHVIVFEKNDAVETQVAEADVKGSAQGTQTPIDVDWKASTTYRVEVKVDSGRFHFDQSISPNLVTPATACKKEESPTPTASDSPSPSKSAPAESATPTPSASESSSAPAATSSNAPSPAAGDSNLAETGANSNTPLIAGIAAALVVVGGGAVFFGMRRRGARDNG